MPNKSSVNKINPHQKVISPAIKKTIIRDIENGIYLYQGDTFLMMDALIAKNPKGIFDMIFADPPYFLSNGGSTCQNGEMVSVDKGKWDKSAGIKINHEFNLLWLEKCQKLLKSNGTIWITGTAHIIHSIGFALQQLDYKLLNDITWEKPNPPPNLSCRYFTHSTETVIWAAKNLFAKHHFNYDDMRQINGGKQMKTVWNMAPPKKSEKEFGKHPTQKPIELVERCILASTKKGEFIFDPFAGSSTTGVAALKHGRQFMGFEAENDFIELSKKRLLNEIKRSCND